ncbi:MAG: hypothetical protein SFY69_11070 [Planctomycetota bacterium]|nr:hypothetical protein [Planctomycetota bacterium]
MRREARAERRPRGGSILLECLLALALFVGAGLTIFGMIDLAAGSVARSHAQLRAADVARSAMSRIEAGMASPETLTGPVRATDLGLTDAGGAGDDTPTLWELDVSTEPLGVGGLTKVTVRAFRLEAEGSDRETASFTLVEALRLTGRTP